MEKSILIDKVNAMTTFDKPLLLSWISCLPTTSTKTKPSTYLVGDVFMHPIFKHPYILLKKEKDQWICGLITSDADFSGILEPCKSRFFTNNFFSKLLFTTKEPIGVFMAPYENKTHLRAVHSTLKQIFG